MNSLVKNLRIVGIIVAIGTIVLDQISKYTLLSWFVAGNQQIKIAPFLNIILATNRGISFGMLAAGSVYGVWLLIFAALCIIVLLAIWLWQAETKFSSVCFGLIMGGAIGNVIDRFLYNVVIDFLDFHAFNYHWYTFNIADCGIVIGTILLSGQMLFGNIINKKNGNSYDTK